MPDTADPFDGLPPKYDYIREVTLKYTPSPDQDDGPTWGRLVDGFTPAQLREITEVYRRLGLNDDFRGLSAWIEAADHEWRERWERYLALWEVAKSDPSQADVAKSLAENPPRKARAGSIFRLFSYLALNGVSPFTRNEVVYSPPPKRLDWDKLPAALGYLRAPAMRWGRYAFDDDRCRAIDGLSDADRLELRGLAQRTRRPDDRREIDAFIARYPFPKHQESARVYFLLVILEQV
jgi:hypothetical protein